MKRYLALFLAALMLLGMSGAIAEDVLTEIPREEIVYFNGLIWGAPSNFNPVSGSPSWPAADQNEGMFESLYMFNMLTGKSEPLLADGDVVWEDDYNFVVKVKDAAKWNDGTPLTNEDVAYTYDFGNKYSMTWSNNWIYLEKVEAIEGNAVRFTLKEEPYDRIQVIGFFDRLKILPKHIWEAREAETGEDIGKLMAFTDLESVVASGPYMPYYYDDTRIIVVRNDEYWGQDESMFGKLPAPKYLGHMIFTDNAAGNLSLQEGAIDVSQQFIAGVAGIKAADPLITTYLADNPYYVAGTMPSIVFNTTIPGLDDPIVRRAIALCIDYQAIADDAMDGMTDPIVTSLFLMNTSQADLLNESDIINELRFDTQDIDENRDTANALLDEAGYVDADGDGFRDLPDGTPIAWELKCPYGWSDWNASLEIVSRSAESISLNLKTNFPETPVYDNDRFFGNFDIIMQSPFGTLTSAAPWSGIRNVVYSKGNAGIGEYSFWNNGRYTNPEMDELIDKIAGEKDLEAIKAYYTQIEEMYLKDLPTVPLMYRPWVFHTVSEHVWTGFPVQDDGTGIPPQIASYGAGIRTLYQLELAN